MSDCCEQTALNMFLIQLICKKDQGTTTANKKYSLKPNKTSVKILTNISFNMLWTLDISDICEWTTFNVCLIQLNNLQQRPRDNNDVQSPGPMASIHKQNQ